jgi:hypothetical protein
MIERLKFTLARVQNADIDLGVGPTTPEPNWQCGLPALNPMTRMDLLATFKFKLTLISPSHVTVTSISEVPLIASASSLVVCSTSHGSIEYFKGPPRGFKLLKT